MRINKFVAQATGLSRRSADQAIAAGRVSLDGQAAQQGDDVADQQLVTLDGQTITPTTHYQTLILHKPVGYVCSRAGQGNATVYDLLPPEYHNLNIAGRLDKDSSGLLILTNDGDLANQLTHPRYAKSKTYEINLNKPLAKLHQQLITGRGVQLDDGLSRLTLSQPSADEQGWQITMHEGRNRQIRRTFAALGYSITSLHRSRLGGHNLAGLKPGQYKLVNERDH